MDKSGVLRCALPRDRLEMSAKKRPGVPSGELTAYLDPLPALLGAAQAAPVYNRSEDSMRMWLDAGVLPSVEINGRRYVRQADIRDQLGLPPLGSA